MKAILNWVGQPRQTPHSAVARNAEVYASTPLKDDEFRILTVCAGSREASLVCTLRKAMLTASHVPSYETISYTWGQSNERGTVTVNDEQINVPTSAISALKCVRKLDADRDVWIDSIAIDQDNLDERSQQVALMARIYQWSRGNLIFLGDGETNSLMAERAFANIKEIVSEVSGVISAQATTLRNYVFADGYYMFATKPMETPIENEAINWLYARPWFSRLWVLQEAVLAPRNTALCGNASIDFELLLTATAWFEHQTFVMPNTSIATSPGFRGANNIWLIRSDLEHGATYVHPTAALLQYAPFGECSNLRDQVFALVGLYQRTGATNRIPLELRPDYRKSVAAVLRDATRYAITEQRALSILERLPLRRPDRPVGLPSWVPEWFRYHQRNDARALGAGFRACGNSNKWTATDGRSLIEAEDPNVLRLRGLIVDRVHEVSSVLCIDDVHHADKLLAWMEKCQSMIEAVGLGVESIGNAVTGGTWFTNEDILPIQAAVWSLLLEHLQTWSTVPPAPPFLPQDANQTERSISGFLQALSNASIGRRFFVTEGGRLGIGPGTMGQDTFLTVLQAGTLLFVLQQQEQQYLLLGPAYSPGIMWGEAVQDRFPEICFDIL